MEEFNALLERLHGLVTQPRTALLVALLVTAAAIDWRTYRIPNWLTAGGMAAALVVGALTAPSAVTGVLGSVAGLAAGLAMLLPLYALHAMGAGDVKLMGMAGAFLGWPDILYAVLCTLVVGGVAAVVFAIRRKALRRMAGNAVESAQAIAFAALAGIRPSPVMAGHISVGRLPYGVSICIGTIGWLAAAQLGYA